MACLATVLLCIWDPIQAALLACVGTAVEDSLGFLRERLVATIRNFTLFWGNQVEPVPISSTGDLVGMDEIRGYQQKIGDYLKDDDVGVIGIFGMGGVGKTTLLERINNNFREIGAPGFEVVIYVIVSKDATVLKIQKSIGDRIGLNLSSAEGSDAISQAQAICKALSKRRFLLLLDDVWEETGLTLTKLGIPQPTAQNKWKVILTTRSKEVCHSMRAKLLEVKVLNESESWKLFRENVGTEAGVDRPDINPHAKAVARKCGGLPLALITVGCAMADVTSVGEWKLALRQLREAPYELPGMTDKVLSLLYFSFDRLRDETLKQCLLYCCLYPEDYNIPVEEIIEHWVGEGFLDTVRSNSILEARNRGRAVITRLKKACLLQESAYGIEEHVKMHDVVREMCLWRTGGEIDKDNAFLVLAGLDHHVPASEISWGNKKRISLMRNETECLPRHAPSCPNLHTLLCYGYLRFGPYVIQTGFFESMPVLRVLDLSWTRLEELPEDVGLLTELRYLNLDYTDIRSLPKGLGKLENLNQLSLINTNNLRHIPREAIPALTRLRTLSMIFSGYEFGSLMIEWEGSTTSQHASPSSSSSAHLVIRSMEEDEEGEGTLQKYSFPSSSLMPWDKLEELQLSVRTLHSREALFNSDRLCRCCVRLQIYGHPDIQDEHLSLVFEKLENLQFLRLNDWAPKEGKITLGSPSKSCTISSLILYDLQGDIVIITSPCSFEGLRKLEITSCHDIHDLAWVQQLPVLEHIEVDHCAGIKELLLEVGGGGAEARECDSSSLRSLKSLILSDLPIFTSISSRPMLFPSLEYLRVIRCPQLKKLPLTSCSAPSIKKIECDKEWWEELEWDTADGDSVQSRFLPHCILYNPRLSLPNSLSPITNLFY